jgi:hypothetical protein
MRTLTAITTLCTPVTLLYCQFLWNPVVFDDTYFFDGRVHEQYLNKFFSFDLRWLPYATFEWTRVFFGLDLIWLHLGNLGIHLLSTITLFLFLRRLFENQIPKHLDQQTKPLPGHWLAFLGALIFSLHPVSVYAVNYLSQRSILMATLFTLITWRCFLEGLLTNRKFWLLISSASYLLAALSKEHAIMAPAISGLLALLVNNGPRRKLFTLIYPAFILYGFIAIFIVAQVKLNNILGQAYEPMASDQFSKLGDQLDLTLIYPLSILTQSYLFFEYIWIWLVPSPAWMSIDIYPTFALHLLSWPETLGFIAFIIYPFIGFRFLLDKGLKGLFGLAMLCPWFLFATELSTVRIQESFVLYRSYLWMTGIFAALPFIFQRFSAKQTSVYLLSIALMAMPLSWLRLKTFSHPVLLWDDAAKLVENHEYRPGMERIYYNRGTELIRLKQYDLAMKDLNKTLILGTETGYLSAYAFSNRGYIYKSTARYPNALSDYNSAIQLNPTNPVLYIAKAEILAALNDPVGTQKAFSEACKLGSPLACRNLTVNNGTLIIPKVK